MIPLLLLACLEAPTPGPPPGPDRGPPEVDPDAIPALDLPGDVPFRAWTRAGNVTLVDERGRNVLVLQPVAIAVEVRRLLSDRALLRCTGCRAPVDGWLQRSLLHPGGPSGSDRPEDRLVEAARALPPDQQRVADHGFTPVEDGVLRAPPWWGEPGFGGPVLEARWTGDGWAFQPVPAGDRAKDPGG